MKKVSYLISTMRHGAFLDENCSTFGQALFQEFEKCQNNSNFHEEAWYKMIDFELKSRSKNISPELLMRSMFCDNLYLEVDFSHKLRLFDSITHDCFKPKGKLGSAMLVLVDSALLSFTLYRRKFEDCNHLTLEFETCFDAKEYPLYETLLNVNTD